MGVCKCTSKVSLCVLSFFLWVAAGGLIVIGVKIYSDIDGYTKISTASYILEPVAILFAVAIFLFLLGIIGCVGAFKEQKCLLGMFATILLAIFIGTVAAACLAYFYRGGIDKAVSKHIHDAIQQYNESSEAEGEVDEMQQALHCCGVDSYNDWRNTSWYRQHEKTNKTLLYPESCCSKDECDYTENPANDTALYKQGCHQVLKDQFIGHLDTVAYIATVFAILQLLGMISSCALICRRRGEVPYIGFSNPDSMQV